MAHTVNNKADSKRMKGPAMTQNLEQQSSTEEQLLPGIHNEITLQKISTKLPWITFHILSSVSRAWRAAVRSREILDARVRSHSTDTLVVLKHTLSRKTWGIALYSIQAKRCYRLPPIPEVVTGIQDSCKCVTMDGKIYILGVLHGLQSFRPLATEDIGSNRVYMFDVAAQGGWKTCASMQAARKGFACSAINGKIYICGGASCCTPGRAPVCGTEVYDPKTDKWTTVMPMPSWRAYHGVGVIGDELLVYGGAVINLDMKRKRLKQKVVYGNFRTPRLKYTYRRSDDRLEVYNTREDKWRKVELKTDPGRNMESFFIAEGRLYSVSPSTIFVFDFEKNTKTPFQSSLLPRSSGSAPHLPITALAVNHELLVVTCLDAASTFLSQSRGFGMEDTTVVWEKLPETLLSLRGIRYPFMVLLHV
ncbi:unnamed protein product [Calypogeia fissa]